LFLEILSNLAIEVLNAFIIFDFIEYEPAGRSRFFEQALAGFMLILQHTA